jgi:hypothetical protein
LAGQAIETRQHFQLSLTKFTNDYVAIRSIADLSCGLAGDTTFTNNLDDFSGPVIMFVAGHGFGSAMFDTAQLMTSADVTINYKEQYGHVDYVTSTKHLQQLEHPILTWLTQEVVNQNGN